ncbi:SH3 domain-containing protein [Clostridium tagluense]|uniref:SH3 domain-containing protein n=1 Tax=Clostridium tagluense TaxID=360422 RepID=UPI001CF3FE26|nr:N-acetylmuramoyl-L-alanine amidase [Clostridium tagluense]MCB2300413.1 N-acetylmuramoyl-L-alanine amidase [Clostridium tagluense]
MSKIAVRRGHQYTGRDGATDGYVKEIDVAERYYKLVMQKFRALGHQVLDVTPSEANRSLSDSLNYGVDMANSWGADYLISCHANAFETDVARGCEVVCGSNNGLIVGQRIVNEFIKLGFQVHQGAYMDVRGLAEIKSFKGITLICEPFFCDSKLDVAIYNRVGADGIANAIVKGLLGQVAHVANNATTGIVTASVLNVRESANTSSRVLGQLKKGDKVKIDKKVGSWYSIYFGNHGGYVSADFIK